MYFNEKEDTNIDKEFNNKKGINVSLTKKLLIIISIIVLLIIIILILIAVFKNKKNYFIALDGAKEMTIYQGTTYIEPGYRGFDNKQNTYDVIVDGEVDTTKIGTYTITYKLKNTTETRTVNVVEKPNIATNIHLNGEKSMIIKEGSTYTDPGYTAIDAVDGDLTDKVTINGSVNTSKKGTYRIIYSVVNSSGITTSETRMVVVE